LWDVNTKNAAFSGFFVFWQCFASRASKRRF
jgi:hypothetical protein